MQADSIIASILEATNYYDVLNVDRNAQNDDIRKAFLYRSKFAHPDKSNNPKAKDAFHKLKVAYETLKSPRNRRLYDGGLLNDLPNAANSHAHQNWTVALHEIFDEFMKSNYEPVLAVVDYFPELSMYKESFRTYLVPIQNALCAMKIRYELVQPELEQLNQLRGQQYSIFNLVGRVDKSLQTTKLLLSIAKKSLDATPSSAEDQSGQSDNDEDDDDSGIEGSGVLFKNQERDLVNDVNVDLSLVTCLERAIAVVDIAEERMRKINSWTSWGICPSPIEYDCSFKPT